MAHTLSAALIIPDAGHPANKQKYLRKLQSLCRRYGWPITKIYVVKVDRENICLTIESVLRDADKGHFKILLAWSFSQIGSSLSELYVTMCRLRQMGVVLKSHMENLDTGTAIGKAAIELIRDLEIFEHAVIQHRVKAGIARTKAVGRTRTGRPVGRPKISDAIIIKARKMRSRGSTLREIAYELSLSVGLVHRVTRGVEVL